MTNRLSLLMLVIATISGRLTPPIPSVTNGSLAGPRKLRGRRKSVLKLAGGELVNCKQPLSSGVLRCVWLTELNTQQDWECLFRETRSIKRWTAVQSDNTASARQIHVQKYFSRVQFEDKSTLSFWVTDDFCQRWQWADTSSDLVME